MLTNVFILNDVNVKRQVLNGFKCLIIDDCMSFQFNKATHAKFMFRSKINLYFWSVKNHSTFLASTQSCRSFHVD